MAHGLTSADADKLLKEYGYNELPSAKPKSVFKIALEVLKEPMFILLIACGSVYVLLGDYTEGVILLFWVFVIIFITFYQHRKTEQSLEALRQLSSPRALVIRDGKELRIAGREVVPGDVMILHEGDRIAADALVVESDNLTIDEALLTGESVPVVKATSQETEQSLKRVFSGTLVVQGKGLVNVTATGLHTEFGKIGLSLKTIEQDATRLQKEMKTLIRNLFIGGAVVSLGVVAAFYATRGNFLHAVLSGLAAAMALLPEEFPVVLTIFLALGAWRLSKINVLTRRPSAIETLGSATVLCSDKTGTITQNKMEVDVLFSSGQFIYKSDFANQRSLILPLLKGLFYASASQTIDPMEKAIGIAFESQNASLEPLELLKEYPLHTNFLAMTRVYRPRQGTVALGFCKGAPEAVFSLCKLPENEVAHYTSVVQHMAKMGYRVLAAATATSPEATLPEKQSELAFAFAGLVGFLDPIRPEVPTAIQHCNNAGIKVIMITGDYPATALNIASQIGINHLGRVITGDELRAMQSEELKEKIKQTCVFARIIPEQKLQIIKALKANGEVVAMTGDGVNDAPALKAADIGIAMGLKGTDVAREASSLVLLDDNFASIVQAVRSGRRIFDNLEKAMSYIVAIHIPIIGLVLLPAFFSGLPILLMPLHIVFMELIIDPVCSIAFETEQEEKGVMHRPPRKPDELFFGVRKMLFSFLKGVLLLGVVIAVYFLSIREGHTEAEVRAIAFSTLIIGNVLLILTSLSDTRNFSAVLREKNRSVIIICAAAFMLLFLTLKVPFLQTIFSFSFPGYQHFLTAFAGAMGMLMVLELLKKKRSKNQVYTAVEEKFK